MTPGRKETIRKLKETIRELAEATGTQLGSSVKPPRRCSSCHNVIKHDEDSPFCERCAGAEIERSQQGKFRAALLERDRGVCANPKCRNRDTLEIRAMADEAKARGGKAWAQCLLMLLKAGYDEKALEEGHALWVADHIVELVAGGSWSLSNGQTLCQPCSKAKTSDFAKKRGDARKPRGRFGR
jgi:5-methylcytosine-specific restriction endonuclease McrA